MSDIKIHIVYFGYLDAKDKNWKNSHPQKVMLTQLNDIKEFGLVEAAKTINIVFTNPKKSDFNNAAEKRADEIIASVKETLPSAIINRTPGNQHEYPGIHLVWNIANDTAEADRKNTVILYFHAKDITHDNSGVRSGGNMNLTDTVIKPWKAIVERFKRDPAINKAGRAASDAGFIWYNFWWARASYIAACERPILTERRHYYEDWVGRLKEENPAIDNKEPGKFSGPADCLSLCAGGPDAPLGIAMSPNMEKCTQGGGRMTRKMTLKLKRLHFTRRSRRGAKHKRR